MIVLTTYIDVLSIKTLSPFQLGAVLLPEEDHTLNKNKDELIRLRGRPFDILCVCVCGGGGGVWVIFQKRLIPVSDFARKKITWP